MPLGGRTPRAEEQQTGLIERDPGPAQVGLGGLAEVEPFGEDGHDVVLDPLFIREQRCAKLRRVDVEQTRPYAAACVPGRGSDPRLRRFRALPGLPDPRRALAARLDRQVDAEARHPWGESRVTVLVLQRRVDGGIWSLPCRRDGRQRAGVRGTRQGDVGIEVERRRGQRL